MYNIAYCQGIKGEWWSYLKVWRNLIAPLKLDYEIVEEMSRLNPDVISFVEIDNGSLRARKKDQVKFFSEALKMQYLIERVKYPTKSFVKLFNHIPILRNQCNAIISKSKLENIKYHYLKCGVKRVLIEATVDFGTKTTILLAHLSLGKKTREKQIREIANIVNSIEKPVILMGDFNTFRGEDEIEDLLNKTHLQNCYRAGKDKGNFTYPSYRPNKQLDYILTSANINVKNYEVLNLNLSDHRPILVDLEV